MGLLEGAEREAAEARRRDDAAFRAAVAAWEERLVPLGNISIAGKNRFSASRLSRCTSILPVPLNSS